LKRKRVKYDDLGIFGPKSTNLQVVFEEIGFSPSLDAACAGGKGEQTPQVDPMTPTLFFGRD
jgi:hypothetical protein